MGSEITITSDGENFLTVGEKIFKIENSNDAAKLIKELGWDFVKILAHKITQVIYENGAPQSNIEQIIEAAVQVSVSLRDRLLAQALDDEAVGKISVSIILEMAKKPGTYIFSLRREGGWLAKKLSGRSKREVQ